MYTNWTLPHRSSIQLELKNYNEYNLIKNESDYIQIDRM